MAGTHGTGGGQTGQVELASEVALDQQPSLKHPWGRGARCDGRCLPKLLEDHLENLECQPLHGQRWRARANRVGLEQALEQPMCLRPVQQRLSERP